MTTMTADDPARVRISRPKTTSDDLERCVEIGQKVLVLLDKGVHRVEIYRYASGKERVEGVRLAS